MQSDPLAKVLSLDRAGTIEYLSKLGIEHENCTGRTGCRCDSEVLQGLLLSYCYCVPNFSLLYEVADGFQESFDLVQILVDSGDGRLTNDTVQQLMEQENPHRAFSNVAAINVSRHSGVLRALDEPVDSQTLIAVTENSAGEDAQISENIASNTVEPSGASVTEVSFHQVSFDATASIFVQRDTAGIQVIAPPLLFGVNECTVKVERTLTDPAPCDNTGLSLPTDTIGETAYPIRQRYVWQDTVMVTSAVHRYATALDCMFDRLYWGWEGNWDQNLEGAILQLLVAVDDDLVGLVRSWVSVMGGSGAESQRNGASDMQHLLDSVILDVQNAMNVHSTYAVGRLHQTLVQFVDAKDSMSMIMRIPEGFTHAINDFIQAKLEASAQVEMQRDLNALIKTAKEFLRQLHASPKAAPAGRQNRNVTALEAFVRTAEAAAVTPIATASCMNIELARLIHELKPQAMEMIATAAIANWDTDKIDLMPYIPLNIVRDLSLLTQCAHQLSETLIMDAINIDTFMGYHMRVDNVPESAAIISSLLEVGFAYVTSESGKLMGLLPMERSMLVLNNARNSARSELMSGAKCEVVVNDGRVEKASVSKQKSGNQKKNPPAEVTSTADATGAGHSRVGTKFGYGEWINITSDSNHNTVPAGATAGLAGSKKVHFPFVMPAQLRRRAKDMQRVFRNNVKKTLSLRLNSNFDLAIQRLHQHHGSDCWVGVALQAVWRCMAATSPPQLLIFELWYGEDMIAADYAHPTKGGSSVYVATRFFDRSVEFRNLIPGFLLALVETKYLQRLGCNIWDLGTANLCPLMRYKLDLTGQPYARPQALYELARVANAVAAQSSVLKEGDRVNQMHNLRAGTLIDSISVHDLLCDE